MYPRQEMVYLKIVKRWSRQLAVPNRVIMIIFYCYVRGWNGGNTGLEHLAYQYGISTESISNYIRHVLFILLHILQCITSSSIHRSLTEELHEMERLVYGFPKWVGLVYGTKQKRFPPANDELQNAQTHNIMITTNFTIFQYFCRQTCLE